MILENVERYGVWPFPSNYLLNNSFKLLSTGNNFISRCVLMRAMPPCSYIFRPYIKAKRHTWHCPPRCLPDTREIITSGMFSSVGLPTGADMCYGSTLRASGRHYHSKWPSQRLKSKLAAAVERVLYRWPPITLGKQARQPGRQPAAR